MSAAEHQPVASEASQRRWLDSARALAEQAAAEAGNAGVAQTTAVRARLAADAIHDAASEIAKGQEGPARQRLDDDAHHLRRFDRAVDDPVVLDRCRNARQLVVFLRGGRDGE